MATIAENLLRIQQAKADIKDSIEAKGVIVPSSATIDTYNDYVLEISSGGGNPTPRNLSDWSYDDNGNVKSIIFSAATVPDYTYNQNTTLESVTILSSTSGIGDYAFAMDSNGGMGGEQQSESLSSVTFNEGLVSIGNYAFKKRMNINELTFPNSLKTIGNYAFESCQNLKRINSDIDGVWNIPSGLTSIGSNAFAGYNNNEIDIYFSSNAYEMTIYDSAFGSNSHLKTVTIPSITVPDWNYAFSIDTIIYVPCAAVHDYRISNGFNSYADNIFPISSATSCETINYKVKFYDENDNLLGTIPITSGGNTINSAMTQAYASSTYRVEFGDCFSSLAAGAFKGFSHLKNIDLDGNLSYIDANVFSGCTSLESITLRRNAVVYLGNINALTNTNDCIIYVQPEYIDGYKSHWNWKTYKDRIQPIPTHDYSQDYLTLNVISGGTISWSGSSTANTLSYSLDDGSTWASINDGSINVLAGDKVLWKGTATPIDYIGIGQFSGDNSVRYDVEGNIMSLLFGDNFSGQTDLTNYNSAFVSLFFSNQQLLSAENLVLPATTLASNCYYYMFNGCSALTTAPELPATTLASNCYSNMFYGCSALTTAPELLATTLASNCYQQMFGFCTSLTTAPVLSATTLAKECCKLMFYGCSALTTAPELPVTTLGQNCYQQMFDGCTSLTTAPELPATTLEKECYSGMFNGCTALTIAPVLSAETLSYGCYNGMFYGCTSLSAVTCLATNISAANCTRSWLGNVASSGTFTKAASMSSWTTGADGIPSNWTVQDAS